MKSSPFHFWLIIFLLVVQSCVAQNEEESNSLPKPSISIEKLQQVNSSPHAVKNYDQAISHSIDFRIPAKKVMSGVVHIISTYKGKPMPKREMEIPEFFKDFFGDDFEFFFENPNQSPMPRIGSGSGVILTDDGYILTNNHVIQNADSLEIILYDNRSYEAKVIGTDPATDLALVKIEEKNLEFVKLGDSDVLEIGEWVLAVGNPFNLSTTVTAGIVSAKARNINMIRDQASIESFIQTDAAVNPGNSGGALVNLKGELIGINTAIASPTGAYAGYAFAVPVNIAKKVVDDLLNFGKVQRAYLGVYIRNLNSKLTKELGLESTAGIYIDSIVGKSAAEEAGIRKKDVIIKINGEKLESSPRLQEVINRFRPGDKILVTLIRKGKEKTIEVKLKGKADEPATTKKGKKEILEVLGIEVENLTAKERNNLKLQGGVKVRKIFSGKIRRNTDLRQGFIISKVNNESVTSVEEFVNILEKVEGGVMLEGVYPDSPNAKRFYAFGL